MNKLTGRRDGAVVIVWKEYGVNLPPLVLVGHVGMCLLPATEFLLLILGEAFMKHFVRFHDAWRVFLKVRLELTIAFECIPAMRTLYGEGVASVEMCPSYSQVSLRFLL